MRPGIQCMHMDESDWSGQFALGKEKRESLKWIVAMLLPVSPKEHKRLFKCQLCHGQAA